MTETVVFDFTTGTVTLEDPYGNTRPVPDGGIVLESTGAPAKPTDD